MYTRNTLTIALVVLALSNLAAAEFIHEKFKKIEIPQVAVSGPRVSGARAIEPIFVTKSEKVKAALGLFGPTVATVVPPGCKSAYSYVKGNPAFSFLDTALQATGLVSVLDDPALVATVFAPTDAAFTSSLAALRVTPQELFDDVATLTVLLKYHVIPGLSLEARDFRDSQLYDTLLTDKKKNKYPVQYDVEKEIDLKSIRDGTISSEKIYRIVPSGGKAAKVVTFDINANCPTVVHVIDRVLIPDYKDALAIDGADTIINILTTYQDAGVPLFRQ